MASLAPLQGSLGRRRAAHLLRRSSFRFTKQKVNQLAGMNATTAATLLLTPPPFYLTEPIYADPAANPPVPNTTWIMPGDTTQPPATVQDFTLRRWVISWWLSEAYEDPGAMHKMIFFMHQYNIVTASTLTNTAFFDYLRLLRWGAFGNWRKFAYKIIFDNVMLRYLTNYTNSATNPQENFAREFLELFTIGKGPQVGSGDYTNYTEDDIVQAAKVLTGCRLQTDRTIVDPETGIPSGKILATQHNWTEKKFSARFQNFTIPAVTVSAQKTAAKVAEEINLFVDMIFAQDETAKNFCRRLYRYYVNEKITPEIETDIIVPLANTFRSGNYEIKPVLQQLLSSQHFYGEDNTTSVENFIGGIIRSPLEAALQSYSFFNVTIPDGTALPASRYRFFSSAVMDRILALGGMNIFQSSDVAGYPAYYQIPDYSHQWFNSSTIIARYKLPAIMLSGKFTIGSNVNGTIGVKLDIVTWTKTSGFFTDPSDAYLLVQELLDYLLPKEVDADRFAYFYDTIFLNNLPPSDWTYEWENYLATNVSTEVKIPLEKLVNAIMYSQEFQTY